MKRTLFTAIILICLATAGQAQQMDRELSSLVSLVKMLRDGSSVSIGTTKIAATITTMVTNSYIER